MIKIKNPYKEIQNYASNSFSNGDITHECILFTSVVRMIGEKEFNNFFNSSLRITYSIYDKPSTKDFLDVISSVLKKTDCFTNIEHNITLRSLFNIDKTYDAIYEIIMYCLDESYQRSKIIKNLL